MASDYGTRFGLWGAEHKGTPQPISKSHAFWPSQHIPRVLNLKQARAAFFPKEQKSMIMRKSFKEIRLFDKFRIKILNHPNIGLRLSNGKNKTPGIRCHGHLIVFWTPQFKREWFNEHSSNLTFLCS